MQGVLQAPTCFVGTVSAHELPVVAEQGLGGDSSTVCSPDFACFWIKTELMDCQAKLFRFTGISRLFKHPVLCQCHFGP